MEPLRRPCPSWWLRCPQFILNDFTLAETSATFISSHENLFPCETDEAIQEAISLTDDSIGYVQLAKNTQHPI